MWCVIYCEQREVLINRPFAVLALKDQWKINSKPKAKGGPFGIMYTVSRTRNMSGGQQYTTTKQNEAQVARTRSDSRKQNKWQV
jgi:hypothetical protein